LKTFTDIATARMAEQLTGLEKAFSWRVHRWGCVCLTFKEAQALVYEAQALYEGMEGRAISAYVAARMRTTRQHVLRLLDMAQLCLLYLQYRSYFRRASDLLADIGFSYQLTRCEFSAPVEGKWTVMGFPVRRAYSGEIKAIGTPKKRHWKNLLRSEEKPFRPPTIIPPKGRLPVVTGGAMVAVV